MQSLRVMYGRLVCRVEGEGRLQSGDLGWTLEGIGSERVRNEICQGFDVLLSPVPSAHLVLSFH